MVGPRVAGGRGDKRPSLWLDVESSRGTTEIAWLNGAVADRGEALGIPTPVNRTLARLIEEITADPTRRHELAGHPRRLLESRRRRIVTCSDKEAPRSHELTRIRNDRTLFRVRHCKGFPCILELHYRVPFGATAATGRMRS